MRIALALALLASPALADPVGSYLVEGVNPGIEDGTYSGRVEVVRLGETYMVTWWVGDEVYEGIGIGGTVDSARIVTGPASSSDTVLVIGYATGTVVMQETAEGMSGHWAVPARDALGREVWIRQD